jgi:uncharacterized protein
MNNDIPLKFRLLAAGFHVAAIMTSIGLFLVPIVWISTRQLHPFVDRSGKDAINCMLNSLMGTMLFTLLCVFVFAITCGTGSQDPSLLFLTLIPLSLVIIIYSINSIIAAIFAFGGYNFKSRLIYPFIPLD